MNYFSYVIIILIIQSLILYDCWNEIYLPKDMLFYNLISFVCGVTSTYLIFECIKIRTIEQILKAFEDVF